MGKGEIAIKKGKILFFLLLLVFLLGGNATAGNEGEKSRDNYISLASLSWEDAGIGLGGRISEDHWIAGNIDHLSGQEPIRFSASYVYEIPRRFLIWRLYGGGGFNYSNPEGLGLHVLAGSEFLWFFTEYEFGLVESEGYIRAGYRLRF